MPRKQPFPPEPPTQPDLHAGAGAQRQVSGAAPKSKHSQAPTVPPKGKKAAPEPRSSGVAPRRSRKTDAPGATVDEVVADLSKDPRRERDDD